MALTHRLSLQKRQASSKFTSASTPKPSSGHGTGNIRTYFKNFRNSAPFTHRNFHFISFGGLYLAFAGSLHGFPFFRVKNDHLPLIFL